MRRELSPTIDAIVLRGLARDRTLRYATARDMALALEAAIPLAPPSQVGRWVEELVGEALAERTEQIAGIERIVDSGDGGATSSALMTIGVGASAPANEQNLVGASGSRSSPPSRMDLTGPTQPHGARAADPHATMVDRPQAAPPAEDSLSAVAGAPRPRSRRLLVGLLLVPLVGYAGSRMLKAHGTPEMSQPLAAKAIALETRPATPSPSFSVGFARPTTDWLPVPAPSAKTEATADGPPGTAPTLGGTRKVLPAAAPSARPAAPPRGLVPPQATDVAEAATVVPPPRPATANGSSCDPPFYIDVDGTKRYKRYCANL